MNYNMCSRLPLRFKKENTSNTYTNGSVWDTNASGKVTVIGYDGRPYYNRVIVVFTDGTKVSVDVAALNRGNLSNPNKKSIYARGFVGIGENISHRNGKPTKEYRLWISMFVRCYDPQTWLTHPTYKGCEVDERWWNFQVFCEDIKNLKGYAEWTANNNYALDKDTLIKGNNLYAYNRCAFVTELINARAAKTNKIPYKAYRWGKYITTFTAQRDFAMEFGISESSLSRLVNKVYDSHKGWVIIKEEEK